MPIRLLFTNSVNYVTNAGAVGINLHPVLFRIRCLLYLKHLVLLDVILGHLKGVLRGCVGFCVHRLIVLFYNDTLIIEKICQSIFVVLILALV